MAATIALKILLENILKNNGLGLPLASVTGTTTTLTLATSYLKGPFSSQAWQSCPIRITAGGSTSENTYVSVYDPSTGEITTANTITTGATAAVIAYPQTVEHIDRVVEAINRALTLRCVRKVKTQLSFVPDGDYRGAVASYWTGAGTESYESLTGSEVLGDKVLQLTHTGAATAQSSTFPATASSTWYFRTAIRATTASGVTAALVFYDVTNSAVITPTYTEGTGSTTSNAFQMQEGQFTVPATCDQIAVQLTVDASGTVQMAPIGAAPIDARTFPLPPGLVQVDDRVGNFYYGRRVGSVSGPYAVSFDGPITVGGRTHQFNDNGDHVTVTFNFAPGGAVYFTEYAYGTALSAVTDTTSIDNTIVETWAAAELFHYLEMAEPTVYDSGGRATPSKWAYKRKLAIAAAHALPRPGMETIYGRIA